MAVGISHGRGGRKMLCGPAAACRLAAVLFMLLTLPACIVFVSTGPGPVTNANIVFIAVTDDGGLVARLHVSVVSTDGGGWRQEGETAGDGVFRCRVGAGVTRVRASVTPPAGYVAGDPQRWPREIELSGEDLELRVRVKPA
jgi:hypothetical protein